VSGQRAVDASDEIAQVARVRQAGMHGGLEHAHQHARGHAVSRDVGDAAEEIRLLGDDIDEIAADVAARLRHTAPRHAGRRATRCGYERRVQIARQPNLGVRAKRPSALAEDEHHERDVRRYDDEERHDGHRRHHYELLYFDEIRPGPKDRARF
jgi:hypothetical protein